jgi:heme exporter protein D
VCCSARVALWPTHLSRLVSGGPVRGVEAEVQDLLAWNIIKSSSGVGQYPEITGRVSCVRLRALTVRAVLAHPQTLQALQDRVVREQRLRRLGQGDKTHGGPRGRRDQSEAGVPRAEAREGCADPTTPCGSVGEDRDSRAATGTLSRESDGCGDLGRENVLQDQALPFSLRYDFDQHPCQGHPQPSKTRSLACLA